MFGFHHNLKPCLPHLIDDVKVFEDTISKHISHSSIVHDTCAFQVVISLLVEKVWIKTGGATTVLIGLE